MTAPPRADEGSARWSVALALVAMAVLLATCVYVSARKYYWLDELFTYTLATDPSFTHMIGALGRGADGAPPLYPTLAWLWNRAFGASELSLRLLTALAFCGALGVTWRVLWREYGGRPAALGALVSFTASPLVLRQVAEARFYGVLVLLVAAAVWCFHRAARLSRIPVGLWIATAAVHAGLVLCHVYGGLYSAALLLAMISWDRARGPGFRVRWHASVVAGWCAFLPWMPSFLEQSRLFGGRSWIAVPELAALPEMYRFRSPALTVVVVGVVGWWLWARRRAGARAERGLAESPLLFVAVGLFTIPVVAFVLSHVGPSIFLDRYFLPASLGWGIVVAHLVARGSSARSVSPSTPVARAGPVAWWGLVAVLLLFPIGWAAGWESDPLPGAELGVLPDSLRGLPIVVERAHDYLPAVHYARPEHREAAARIARRRGESAQHLGLWGPVRYPLDSAVAMATGSPLAALTDLRLMERRRTDYRDHGIVAASAILCARAEFLLLDHESFRWAERRVADQPFDTRELGEGEDVSLHQVRRATGDATSADSGCSRRTGGCPCARHGSR